MFTDYTVPSGPDGSLSAQMSPTMSDSSRQLYFRLDEIAEYDPDFPSVGNRVTFPSEVAQLSYSEPQTDGTVRQWSANAGSVVFDAVDGSLVPVSGEDDDRGLMTFHFEGITMAPSNSAVDPQFVGAEGTFALDFSGTSSDSARRISGPIGP